jgi:hypothetical protein
MEVQRWASSGTVSHLIYRAYAARKAEEELVRLKGAVR